MRANFSETRSLTSSAHARRVTWLSVGANISMGLLKCGVGLWAQSRALVADGLHSLADLVSDVAVLLGLHVASRPPDENHPYGHQKVATFVTMFIAILLLGFCLALLLDSVRAILGERSTVPRWPALVVALLSLAVKEWLFWRTRRVARETRSSMLLANAWHHRTDSITSIFAAAGIGASILLGEGWAFLDAVVGVLLGGYIAIEGVKLLMNAIKDLMDTAPEQSVIDDLREHILAVDGAVGYHDFRARRVGDMIEVDLHLLVSPEISVKAGHDIASKVKHEIVRRHPEVLNVLIHIEPDTPEHQHERGVAETDLSIPDSGD